jgi:hypothetical protein
MLVKHQNALVDVEIRLKEENKAFKGREICPQLPTLLENGQTNSILSFRLLVYKITEGQNV